MGLDAKHRLTALQSATNVGEIPGDTWTRQGHFGRAGEAGVDPGLHKQEWRMSLPPSFL